MAYDYKKQHEAAKKFIALLSANKIPAKLKASRYNKDIKAVEIASTDSFDALLIALGFPGKVGDLAATDEKSISGKYKAKLITVTKAFPGFQKGDAFFIVNTHTEKGSLKTKDLAPEKLGVTDKKFKSY